MEQSKQHMGEKIRQFIERYIGKRQCLILLPFAVLYSLFIILGDWDKMASADGIRNFGSIILWTLVSYGVLFVLCSLLAMRQKILQKRKGKWYAYVIFFFVCLLCWMPYFMMYFPGWLSNDAVWQMEQALGWVSGSNHHPYFHTMIIKFFFMIGYRLFGTYTGATAFYTFWQMVIMAMTFSFIIYQLYKKGTHLIWVILALLFYAALPINGLLTICMGKDEFFVAALLLFAWTNGEIVFDTEWKREYLKYPLYFITGLLVCLLRSNGIFIFIGTAVCLLLCRKQKKILLCTVAVLLCYFIYHGPVLTALHVEQPDTIEGLTMPTQHILCAYLNGGELTEKEIEMIDQVVPVDQVASYYNPYLFDIVKEFIRNEGNQQVIEENKWEYFKLWLKVGLRNPLQYLEAEVKQTAGYWAYRVADYQYVYGEYFMVDNPFELTTERKLFSYDSGLAMNEFLMDFQDFYNKVWSLGLDTWLLVFGIAYMSYRKRNIMVYVPYIMLLFTLLLATPVYNEFRYAYGIFVAFPFLFSCSFGAEDESVSERKGMGVADEKMV